MAHVRAIGTESPSSPDDVEDGGNLESGTVIDDGSGLAGGTKSLSIDVDNGSGAAEGTKPSMLTIVVIWKAVL